MARRRDMNELQSEIQELFADLWQVPHFSGLAHGFRPAVDCYRMQDPPAVHVLVELPGVNPEDVEITCQGRTLLIAGERRRPRADGAQYQQMELEFGQFQRQILLVDDVDANGATAAYEHGILRIVLPLAPQAPAEVRVPIQVGTRG
jgi:HSP20 family protein